MDDANSSSSTLAGILQSYQQTYAVCQEQYQDATKKLLELQQDSGSKRMVKSSTNGCVSSSSSQRAGRNADQLFSRQKRPSKIEGEKLSSSASDPAESHPERPPDQSEDSQPANYAFHETAELNSVFKSQLASRASINEEMKEHSKQNLWARQDTKTSRRIQPGTELNLLEIPYFEERLAEDKQQWDRMMMQRIQAELERKYIAYEERIYELTQKRDHIRLECSKRAQNLQKYKTWMLGQVQSLESQLPQDVLCRNSTETSQKAEELQKLQLKLIELLKENQSLLLKSQMRSTQHEYSVNRETFGHDLLQDDGEFHTQRPSEDRTAAFDSQHTDEPPQPNEDHPEQIPSDIAVLASGIKELDNRTERIRSVLKAMESEREQVQKEIDHMNSLRVDPVTQFELSSPSESKSAKKLELEELLADNKGLRVHLDETRSNLEQKQELYLKSLATLWSR